MRTAGILLLVDSGLAVISWTAQAHLGEGAVPSWTSLAATSMKAAAGVGLLWVGRQVVLPVLALAVIAALRPLVQIVPLFLRYPSAALLVPAVLQSALAMLPSMLLLVRRPSRARHNVAIALFVFGHLLGVAGLAMRLYVTTRVDTPLGIDH